MNYTVKFIPEAVQDYQSLDGSVKKQVNVKIDKLKENPYLGELLGNKNDLVLSGFYKIYVAKKTYRIVYRLTKEGQIEIIEIWGIGRRDKLEIYKMVSKRIRDIKPSRN
ncbi:toxin ParE [Candidatus Termititenax persephonae]|uniref:Toxin ParE n=1 Tax=Candidatus Termititenax persephonae TaxID=2218525 RepID=A0A388TEN1_9BACT|nr:toxin ParE [Candidatus Termititenax persephonae]